jgi:hypothetical protein
LSEQSSSGNRWEPTAEGENPVPRDDQEIQGELPRQEPGTSWPSRLSSRRAAVAAAGAALFLGTGAVGFGLGHSVSDGSPGTGVPDHSVIDRDGDGDQHRFDGPPGGQPGELPDEDGTGGADT